MAADHHRVYDAKLSAQVLLRPISHPTLDSDFDNVQETIDLATSLIPEPFLSVQTPVRILQLANSEDCTVNRCHQSATKQEAAPGSEAQHSDMRCHRYRYMECMGERRKHEWQKARRCYFGRQHDAEWGSEPYLTPKRILTDNTACRS